MAGWQPAAALLGALLLDAWAGEPAWLYNRLPHPVVLIGRSIDALDRRLHRPSAPPVQQRLAGIALAILVAGGAAAIGYGIVLALRPWSWGWLVEGAMMSTLLAQRSLVDHVRAVADGLRRDLDTGRVAVSRIVGRDPECLDAPAVGRAALESLAENLSDGVVAPLFWGALLGLPGMLAYKALNTLDSMVGHRTPRHLHIGWASARLDDVANLVPARATGLLLTAAALIVRASALGALRAMWRDSRRHRSPNAGWPEAALAGALGLRIAGPRSYGGQPVQDAWMGNGRAEVEPSDIESGIELAWMAWLIAALLMPMLALALA